MKKIILILTAVLFLSNCSKNEDPCSSADNIDNSQCQKNITTISTRQAALNVDFEDSFFFDDNLDDWQTVSKDSLTTGLIGNTVPIYSAFLNLTKESATDKIIEAKEQKENPANFGKAEFNRIPYIEVKYESGVSYQYQYNKKDLNGQVIATVTGSLMVRDNRAFLPLINAMFNNQFFSSTEPIGTRYIHSISITAQTSSVQGTKVSRVEFEAVLETNNTDFKVSFLTDINNYTLNNRFDYYYNNVDGVANNNFNFVSLVQKGNPEAVPVDLKILFKERPKIEMTQELFFENPFGLDNFKLTKKDLQEVRGESFYVKKSILTSDQHFKLKVKMLNTVQNLTDGREIVLTNFPANTPWNVDFVLDFAQNSVYSDTSGKPLIYPLKPTCVSELNQDFLPLEDKNNKLTMIQGEGFYATCHPVTDKTLALTKSQLVSNTLPLTDTHYKFFNYAPLDSTKGETGFFHGIRSVKFKIEGCVRVFVKTPTSSTFELISDSYNQCKTQGDPNSDGWIYFQAEKTFLISDYINDYEGIPGLKSLIQSMGSRPLKSTSQFFFNNLLNNLNHIY